MYASRAPGLKSFLNDVFTSDFAIQSVPDSDTGLIICHFKLKFLGATTTPVLYDVTNTVDLLTFGQLTAGSIWEVPPGFDFPVPYGAQLGIKGGAASGVIVGYMKLRYDTKGVA